MKYNKELIGLPVKATQVKRFTALHLLGHRSSIAEHSYEVVFLSYLLIRMISERMPELHEPLQSKAAAIYEHAMLHDIPEVETGDLPFPVKNQYPELKKALAKVEADFMQAYFPFVNEPEVLVEFIVKIADTIAVAREIITEISIGNTDFISHVGNIKLIFHKVFLKFRSKGVDESLLKTVYDIVVQEFEFDGHIEATWFDDTNSSRVSNGESRPG